MMTRHQRVALELLAPAPLGLLGFGLIALSREMACGGALTMRSQDFLLIVWCLLVACVVAAIPSLIYSLIMEGIFRRGVNPASWLAVALSSALGGLAGAAIALVLCWFKMEEEALILFGVVGLFAGFVIGMLIKQRSAEPDLA
jgi:hypothetical protein